MEKVIDIWYILQSLGFTIVFVGMIGYERQRKHKIAGMTTHILVALGAATLAIVQEVMVQDALQFIAENPALASNIVVERQRIIAQIVAGVGFLGTGAIIKQNGYITGLTTASTLWIGAIIGIVFGLGNYVLGISASVLALLVLTVIKGVFGPSYIPDYEHDETTDESTL